MFAQNGGQALALCGCEYRRFLFPSYHPRGSCPEMPCHVKPLAIQQALVLELLDSLESALDFPLRVVTVVCKHDCYLCIFVHLHPKFCTFVWSFTPKDVVRMLGNEQLLF